MTIEAVNHAANGGGDGGDDDDGVDNEDEDDYDHCNEFDDGDDEFVGVFDHDAGYDDDEYDGRR
eukprot:8705947-Pyramimonas_sp.AAC.1